MAFKEFVPPILRSLVRKTQPNPPGAQWYASYAAAKAACQGGYEDAQLIRTVYEKTRLYRDRLASQAPRVCDLSALRLLGGLSLAVTKRDVTVLDFGGACGAHYFLASAVLGDRVRFRWHVIETASMAAVAQGLADDHVEFFASVPQATAGLETIDVVFSSGALQYVPDPYATLTALTQCGAAALFLTRVGLTRQQAEVITIQTSSLRTNGPGALPEGMPDGPVTYPLVFPSQEKVEEIIQRNYSLDIRFEEEQHAYSVGNMGIDMYGYFATRRKDDT
jgi:putative methyltransferase (TIGR04325 family)